MKSLLMIASLFLIQSVFAGTAPAGFPIVKGVLRKVDIAGSRVSIKHEDIPNLSMPAMTMSFAVKDPTELSGLAAGDNVNFAADEIDGELTAIWIAKAPAVAVASAQLLCTGVAETTPRTNIELEIRKNKFSTIRYEFAEGSYQGTAHINSIGRMELDQQNEMYTYLSGTGPLDSKLEVRVVGGAIVESRFTNFSSGMQNASVDCKVEE